MKLLHKPTTRWSMIIAFCLMSVALLVWTGYRRGAYPTDEGDYSDAPLAWSGYLSDVVEPITMVSGISWDDGGSRGLAFKDSRQQTKYICLMDDLDGEKNLVLGSYSPGGRNAQKIPVGGREEKAMLGLLLRWYDRDPDGKAWADRIERWISSDHRSSIFEGGQPEGQIGKAYAVLILRDIRARNRPGGWK